MTYEEYFNLVTKELKYYLEPYNLSDDEIVAYMNKNEFVIKNHYNRDIKAFNEGKITARQLSVVSVGAVAHTLDLMY